MSYKQVITLNSDGRAIKSVNYDEDGFDVAINYTLDADGHCIKEEETNEDGSISYGINTEYTWSNGNLMTITYPSSNEVKSFTYTSQDLKGEIDVEKILLNHKNSTKIPASSTTTYNSTSYVYNYIYAFDSNGNIIKKNTQDVNNNTNYVESFSYYCD